MNKEDKENQELLSAIFVPQSPFDDLSDDEILYWATPYFDYLQERKTEKQKKLIEEREFREEETWEHG